MTILVGVGGIFGAVLRYLIGKWISDFSKTSFPLGTWFINLTGSFLLGLISFYTMQQIIAQWVWLLFGVGFLGAYTTFSTFGYETMQLIEKKQWRIAILYAISSITFGVLFAWLGSFIGGIFI